MGLTHFLHKVPQYEFFYTVKVKSKNHSLPILMGLKSNCKKQNWIYDHYFISLITFIGKTNLDFEDSDSTLCLKIRFFSFARRCCLHSLFTPNHLNVKKCNSNW